MRCEVEAITQGTFPKIHFFAWECQLLHDRCICWSTSFLSATNAVCVEKNKGGEEGWTAVGQVLPTSTQGKEGKTRPKGKCTAAATKALSRRAKAWEDAKPPHPTKARPPSEQNLEKAWNLCSALGEYVRPPSPTQELQMQQSTWTASSCQLFPQ